MMIRFHREGTFFLIASALVLAGIVAIAWLFAPQWLAILLSAAAAGLYVFIAQFFRHPDRKILHPDDHIVYAPADGTVVTIETVQEPEYFQDERRQVSIFMSPLNVHVNRSPISGTIAYFKYHKGKYLLAAHPKSSTENERTTVVFSGQNGQVLLRQVAGAMARRIRWYVNEGETVRQGDEFGFIKFGSRVDIFLPLTAEVKVAVGDKVRSNVTEIASF
jgi:phosphatidylserine decarboxylase